MLFVLLSVCLLVAVLLLFLGLMFRSVGHISQDKIAPFECGFSPYSSSRSPFSLHFFLVSIIFLLFDVELVLLFPLFLSPQVTILTLAVFSSVLLILI